MIIMGVSLVLVPMFSLSHDFKDIFTKVSFLSFILALVMSFVKEEFVFAFLFISIIAYIAQSVHVLYLRVRKQKDYWFLNVVISFVCFGVAIFILPFDLDVSLNLVMLGFLFHFVIGHLYKILPFLVWYKYISPQVGKKKIPMLHEMIDEKMAYMQVKLSSFGVLALTFGVAFSFVYLSMFGSFLMILSTGTILYNVNYAYKFRNY